MKKIIEKVVPELPQGIRVADKPVGIEFMQKGNERWILAMQALEALPATKCLEIDIAGMSKSQIISMRTALRRAGVKLGHKSPIKFALKGTILYSWSN